jgi:putative hydrolase
MSSGDLPFGFSPEPTGGGGPAVPGGLPDDLLGKVPLFAELQKLLSASGPVNWELARQTAIALAGRADRAVTAADTEQVREAMQLADLWLEPATALPAGVRTAEAWTRVRWIELTIGTWPALCDPVAARVVAAMGSGVAGLGGALPGMSDDEGADLSAALGPLQGILSSLGGLLFGAQVGQALGTLAGEVLGTSDIGLPLGPPGVAALLPANVAAFGEGLEISDTDIRLFLALREAAHHRLYASVPWLRGHVLAAVEAYARGIAVDSEALGRAVTEVDPTDPESLQRALSGSGLFDAEASPEQQAALARLETALALIEGWVDHVSTIAAARLPSAGALAETLRRRRATGGPAEQTFATLVGLKLRPRRLREAAALWRGLTDAKGVQARDAVWRHPDLLPGGDDLDDPDAYVARDPGELLPPED